MDCVFKHRGRKCVVLKVSGHWCGYAETKLKGVGYSDLDGLGPEAMIVCHGGVTFAGELKGHKEWFFGMDFAHYGDATDYSIHAGDKVWSLDEVKEETKKLCDEIIRYEENKPLAKLVKKHQELKKQIEKFKDKYRG